MIEVPMWEEGGVTAWGNLGWQLPREDWWEMVEWYRPEMRQCLVWWRVGIDWYREDCRSVQEEFPSKSWPRATAERQQEKRKCGIITYYELELFQTQSTTYPCLSATPSRINSFKQCLSPTQTRSTSRDLNQHTISTTVYQRGSFSGLVYSSYPIPRRVTEFPQKENETSEKLNI